MAKKKDLRKIVIQRLEESKLKKARKARMKMTNYLADAGMEPWELADMIDSDVIDAYQQLKETGH